MGRWWHTSCAVGLEPSRMAFWWTLALCLCFFSATMAKGAESSQESSSEQERRVIRDAENKNGMSAPTEPALLVAGQRKPVVCLIG